MRTHTIVEDRPSKTTRMFVITFGALADRIEDQIKAQGVSQYDAKTIAQFQEDADAIIRLVIRQFLPESTKRNLHDKLMRRIVKHLNVESLGDNEC